MRLKPLPVIIRYEGKGRADRADWRNTDIVAVFPTEPGDGPSSSMCYSTLGQHSTCASGYIGRRTKPATLAQVRYMLRVLRHIGYKCLRVVARASRRTMRPSADALGIESSGVHPAQSLSRNAVGRLIRA